MRNTKEIFNTIMRYDADGFISPERIDNPSNYGGVTIVFRLSENQEPDSTTFTVGYSRANTGSPVRKPDNFNRAVGNRLALENLENPESLQHFDITILTTLEELDLMTAIRTIKVAVLETEVGDNAWYTSNTKISEVTLSELVVSKDDDSDYENYYESDTETESEDDELLSFIRDGEEDSDNSESYSDDTDEVEVGNFESDNEIVIGAEPEYADGGKFVSDTESEIIIDESRENIGD